jgi:hypothetical protein
MPLVCCQVLCNTVWYLNVAGLDQTWRRERWILQIVKSLVLNADYFSRVCLSNFSNVSVFLAVRGRSLCVSFLGVTVPVAPPAAVTHMYKTLTQRAVCKFSGVSMFVNLNIRDLDVSWSHILIPLFRPFPKDSGESVSHLCGSQLPPRPSCYSAGYSELRQTLLLRFMAFVLCGMRPFLNHVTCLNFPTSLCIY